jgi:hypothetical protein
MLRRREKSFLLESESGIIGRSARIIVAIQNELTRFLTVAVVMFFENKEKIVSVLN